MFSPSSPVTGAPQTGFTSPTVTLTVDSKPANEANQWYATAFGGTGLSTSVRIHAASDPFTVSFWKDRVQKVLPQLGLNGMYASVPSNKHKIITRKGVIVAAGQPPRVMIVRTEIEIPAGAESYDFANVGGALSAHFGVVYQQSAGIGDSVKAGSL